MKRIVTHMSMLAAAAIFASGCVPVRHNLPPEQRLHQPGPGVGGPGPGVLGGPVQVPRIGNPPGPVPPGAIGAAPVDAIQSVPLAATPGQAEGATIQQVGFSCGGGDGCNAADSCGAPRGLRGRLGAHFGGGIHSGLGVSNIPPGGGILAGPPALPAVPATVQVTFGTPEGMQVTYDATGGGQFDSEPLIVPARKYFPQGGLYRLKISNIQNREGVELYPTVELAYANARTGSYLAHASIPLQFTEEDFDQVLTGNFVTKVVYLPDPDFQGPALAGIDTLVSTRLDPGIDPIVEADRRGSILAIIRLGDKDLEMPGAGLGVVGGSFAPPVAGLPAPFAPALTAGCGCPGGVCAPVPPSLPGAIAGVNAPQYGIPITGTPIGLPGPPHIPLGAPAGLKRHVIKNHTKHNIPQPVDKLRIDVRSKPGYSYPNPVSRIRVNEQNINPGYPNHPGLYQGVSQRVDPHCND